MIIEEVVNYDSIVDGKYDRVLYDKFIEAYSVDEYEVLSDKGWINLEGVGKTIKYSKWVLKTSGGKDLYCADKHIVIRCDNLDFDNKKCDTKEIFVKDLELGDCIMTKNGPEMVIELYDTGELVHMYDLQVDRNSEHLYYTSDILSHNSLWLQNITVNAANNGYNVLYLTLEMSVKKVLKRLGSMRLKIPINEYDKISTDIEYMKTRIDNLHKTGGSGNDLFDNKLGKIIVKFNAAGTTTAEQLDTIVKNIIEKKGIKIDMIVIDYLTLMVPPKGMESNLYLKGKFISEGIRAVAAKYEVPVITAIQIAKDAWNMNDITLQSIPESKAIAETADCFFGIIRTEEMKRQNLYRLKLLKQRDGDFTRSQAKFDLNTDYLTLENDNFIDSI
jgi:hypothetical protein